MAQFKVHSFKLNPYKNDKISTVFSIQLSNIQKKMP